MQEPSFDPGDPVFHLAGLALSLQVVTTENIYGVDPAALTLDLDTRGAVLRAHGLSWAGGRERAPGAVTLRARTTPDMPTAAPSGSATPPSVLHLEIEAAAPAPIRCVKLIVRDLEPALVLDDGHGEHPLGPAGELLSYPGRLRTPVIGVRTGETRLAVRRSGDRVRETRFAARLERLGPLAGRGALEIILEEEAICFAENFGPATFVLHFDADHDHALACHLESTAPTLGLRSVLERPDLPVWARDLRLVVTLHGMHWSGRVFLDYAAMRAVLRHVTAHLPGRHVLAYLPGWEGRYYWQYGDYRPDPRLGGDSGFGALCDEARACGVHLMPMFGGNCVNRRLPEWSGLDPRTWMKSATGNRFHGNQPDWDFSRAHDTGWQAWLNPGDPRFRDALASQIETLQARFGFDAVFLDTIHVWINDPDFSVLDGVRALVARLHAAIPGLLLAAEYAWDALLPLFALFQRAWWGADPTWTRRFALEFGHLCEGEPEGRTGVHEFGIWKTPSVAEPHLPGPGYLPTLAFQDDTLERSRTRIDAALARIAAAPGPFAPNDPTGLA